MRSFFRRLTAVLLLGLCALLFLLAGVFNTAAAIGGSGKTVATNVLNVVTSPNVRAAVATKLVTQLQKDADGATRQEIVAHRAEFVASLENVIAQPQTQAIARRDIERLYQATSQQSPSKLNLRPLLYRFTSAMHGVDPRFAAQPKGLHHAVVTIRGRKTPLHWARSLFLGELVLFLLGCILLMVTVRALIRRRRSQSLALGLTFALPGILLLLVGVAARSVAGRLKVHDESARAIARETGSQLSGNIVVSGLLLIVLALIVEVIWIWTRRRRNIVAVTSGESSPLERDASSEVKTDS